MLLITLPHHCECMEEKLNWKEFSAADKSIWMQAAEKALKGKNYEDYLEWLSRDGITLQSYQDISDFPGDESAPGTYPWNRGVSKENNNWTISQKFQSKSLSNKQILKSLEEGVNGVILNFEGSSDFQLNRLLQDVLIEIIDLQIHTKTSQLDALEHLLSQVSNKGLSAQGLKAAVLSDGLSTWDGKSDAGHIQQIIDASRVSVDKKSLIRTVHVDLITAQNEGCSPALELGLALAKGHEYLQILLNAGFDVDQAGALLQFSLGVGPDYLIEIAKLRAIRPLWNQVISAYNPAHDCSSCIHLHVENSTWNYSANDAHNNLLRATSAAMSAVLGNCDSLALNPYDLKLENKDESADRLSRSIQFVLREEAYFNKVADPAGGSWFIEDVTSKLAAKAWSIFQDVEKQGGFIEAGKKGVLQELIAKDQSALIADYKSGKSTWIGVNKHPPKNAISPKLKEGHSAMENLENHLLNVKEGEL